MTTPDATPIIPPVHGRTVSVELGSDSYPIHIGSGQLPELVGRLGTLSPSPSRIACVVDAAVDAALGTTLRAAFGGLAPPVSFSVLPGGEATKSAQQLERLWQHWLAAGLDRRSLAVAIGGGVIGDLVGFAAATYMRGIRLVQVPTTLLAQVDSSVGGKTGINLPGAKNMVGAFWQPSCVLIDTQMLSSLGERELISGLAEVVKYGVIEEAALFAWLETHVEQVLAREPEALRWIIAESCRLKAAVVQQDEREQTGRRAMLNYGHTFAHAIEAVAGLGELLHGEAVAIGMLMASCLAERLGLVDAEVTARQRELLGRLGLPIALPCQLSAEGLWQAMLFDKKSRAGVVDFVLPERIGSVRLVPGVPRESVMAVLREAGCHG
jgi:3-dehydroquinate synthase